MEVEPTREETYVDLGEGETQEFSSESANQRAGILGGVA